MILKQIITISYLFVRFLCFLIIVFDFEKFKKPFMSLMTCAHKLYHKIAAVLAQNHIVCSNTEYL